MKIIGTRVHYGKYGQNYIIDPDTGEEISRKVEVKRKMGRPRKFETVSGCVFEVNAEMEVMYRMLYLNRKEQYVVG